MVTSVKRTRPDEAIELSLEARELMADVRSEMDRWIDEKVNVLQQEMGEEIKSVTENLNVKIDEVADKFKAAREKMDNVLESIERLSANLDAGDGETITSAIQKTQGLIVAVRAELEAREAKWKGIGKDIVNTGLKAASSILKIPFLS